MFKGVCSASVVKASGGREGGKPRQGGQRHADLVDAPGYILKKLVCRHGLHQDVLHGWPLPHLVMHVWRCL